MGLMGMDARTLFEPVAVPVRKLQLWNVYTPRRTVGDDHTLRARSGAQAATSSSDSRDQVLLPAGFGRSNLRHSMALLEVPGAPVPGAQIARAIRRRPPSRPLPPPQETAAAGAPTGAGNSDRAKPRDACALREIGRAH